MTHDTMTYKRFRSEKLKKLFPKFLEMVNERLDSGKSLCDIFSEALDNSHESMVYWMIDVYFDEFEEVNMEYILKKLN